MVMNGTSIRRIYDHFHYSKHPRWLSYEVTDETPLFVNPYTGKSVHQESMRRHFQQCIKFSGLDGKGYTLYSLRSTHITMMLLNGTSVDDISFKLDTNFDSKITYASVKGACIARDLVNEPLSHLNAEKLSSRIEDLSKDAGFKLEVFNEKR
mgnify:CR=1 FL=1